MFLPERPMDYVGPLAMLNALILLCLLGILLLLASGIGKKIINWLKLDGITNLEKVIFGLVVGLGVVAYGVLALGLSSLLYPWAILTWMILLCIVSFKEISEIVSHIPVWLYQQQRSFRNLGISEICVLIFATAILLMSFIMTLAPPNGYDGKAYHLQAPKLFLQSGSIFPFHENVQANFPFTVEMLYTIGLAFKSDVLASTINLTYAVLLVLVIFSFSRRYLGRTQSWLAVAILLGILTFPLWATLQIVDNAWAVYEFLAFYSFVRWDETNNKRWLVFAAILAGLAIGTKYMALGGIIILGLCVLWQSRHRGWRVVFVNGFVFGFVSLIVGSPWYIKNFIWFGNPIFPFVFGGREWTLEQNDIYLAFLRSFNSGKSLRDYLLLPMNIYIRSSNFSTTGFDTPSWLFPLVFLYPFTKKSKVLNWIAVFLLLRFVVWSFASQIRFLLPMYPGLCVLTAHVISDLVGRLKSAFSRKALISVSVGTLMVITLIIQASVLLRNPPLRVVVGLDSKIDYLSRAAADFNAKQYLQRNLDPSARVLLMWLGTGYYCDERCIPDTTQSQWVVIANPTFDPQEVSAELHDLGVTHLLFSYPDYAFLSTDHDPTGLHKQAGDFFLNEFSPACAHEIYADPYTRIYEITCDSS